MSVKVNPSKVLELAKIFDSGIKNVLNQNDVVLDEIKVLCGHDNKQALWKGRRAHTWFSDALRNCANNYSFIYAMSGFFQKLCDDTAEIDFTDGDSNAKVGKALIYLAADFKSKYMDKAKSKHDFISKM